MTSPVMAVGEWSNNADLIADVARLGYLDADWNTLDATYGLGRFWTRWAPTGHHLVTNDLHTPAQYRNDFRHLGWDDDHFHAVVLDPPYKLNGTSHGTGPSSSDAAYGVTEFQSVDDRHQMIRDGITECLRVLRPGRRTDRATGGYLLVKCQDQVNGGRVRWQTHEFAAHAATNGARLVDALHLLGHRPQPPGRSQQHARRNYSTLLVLRKES